MLKNYSDHTLIFKIANQYVEIPPGWSCDLFVDDPELEEFLRQRYPELREPVQETTTETSEETSRSRKRTSKK